MIRETKRVRKNEKKTTHIYLWMKLKESRTYGCLYLYKDLLTCNLRQPTTASIRNSKYIQLNKKIFCVTTFAFTIIRKWWAIFLGCFLQRSFLFGRIFHRGCGGGASIRVIKTNLITIFFIICSRPQCLLICCVYSFSSTGQRGIFPFFRSFVYTF